VRLLAEPDLWPAVPAGRMKTKSRVVQLGWKHRRQVNRAKVPAPAPSPARPRLVPNPTLLRAANRNVWDFGEVGGGGLFTAVEAEA
jgi:hypothetical protein